MPRRDAAARPASAASSGSSASTGAPREKPTGRRVAGKMVTDFTVQLATLTEAGIPIVRALGILQGQARPGPFQDVLGELVEDVSAGTPLSEAMGKHSRSFNPLYTSMVRAGEAGGVLDTILQRLAEYREKAAEIRGRIVNSVTYPLIVILFAIGVVSIVMIWVIPRFVEIFDSFDVEMPQMTQALLGASTFATERWYVVFGVPPLLLVLHLVMMRRIGYRYWFHKRLLRAPLLGPVVLQSVTTNYARTLGTLVHAGVPHLDALGIVRDTTGNEVVRETVEDVRRTVREGEGLATPMAESGVFDDIVVSMVDVGEQTGELDTMLLRVADAYEKSLDARIKTLLNFLEPAMIVAVAVLVGFIVVALFVPLLTIISTLSSQ